MHLIQRYPRAYRHKRCTIELIDRAGAKYNIWRADDSLIGSAESLKDAVEVIEEDEATLRDQASPRRVQLSPDLQLQTQEVG